MNICSLVVHARPEAAAAVRADLLRLEGVEIHGEAEGRLVVTVEHDRRAVVSETIMKFHDVKGVLSSALIYEFSSDNENPESSSMQEVSQ